MPVPSSIDSDTMRRYNKLIDFAKSKGYAGKPELDHNENLRQQVFNEYNKANPKDTVDYSKVKPIQNEIANYRSNALKAIQAGHGALQEGTTPNSFMPGLSQVDGIFGQKTSQWKFPEAYILNKQTGEKKSIGFAPKVDLLAALNK